MRIALATPPYPKTIADGLLWIEKLSKDAAVKQAGIVCFPETYLPGYPNYPGFEGETGSAEKMEVALLEVCRVAKENAIAIIIPMDWYEGSQVLNVAYVISAAGEPLGYQTKNQLDPSEDTTWAPGTERSLFEIDGLKFGITICHEGFRYPESVRWSAMRGAQVVFHPHLTGSDLKGATITEWGSPASPYYEKAMLMRAMENTIYFASVGYATKFPESASSIISPDGKCVVYQPYSEAGVIVAEIDPEKATGYLAKRFK